MPSVGQTKGKELMKEEMVEVGGRVIDKQRGGRFKIQVDKTEHIVEGQVSGRMRRNRIRVLIGDQVDVELSPYDLSKGRIIFRHK